LGQDVLARRHQVTVNAHVYTKAAGAFDALNADVAGLQTAGAVSLMLSGAVPWFPSSGLPVNPAASQTTFATCRSINHAVDPNRPASPATGTPYLDAVLQRMIAWDGTYWRDAWSGAIV
jgi:hypothetical protein